MAPNGPTSSARALLPLCGASLALHALLFVFIGRLPRFPDRSTTSIEVTVMHPPPPKVVREAPRPPPPPPPPPERVARLRRPVLAAIAPSSPPSAPPPAPSFGAPLETTIDDPAADVAVPVGDTVATDPSAVGPAHPGVKMTQVAGQPSAAGSSGSAGPVGPPVHLAELPRVLRDAPQLDCPAFASGELVPPQEVRLAVDVTAAGRIAGVRVVRGVGHGCDEIARRAVAQLAFTPAIGSDGTPMAATITWRYDFTAADP